MIPVFHFHLKYYRRSLNNVKDKFISILFLTYNLKFLIVCYIKQIASVASRERADTAYPVL